MSSIRLKEKLEIITACDKRISELLEDINQQGTINDFKGLLVSSQEIYKISKCLCQEYVDICSIIERAYPTLVEYRQSLYLQYTDRILCALQELKGDCVKLNDECLFLNEFLMDILNHSFIISGFSQFQCAYVEAEDEKGEGDALSLCKRLQVLKVSPTGKLRKLTLNVLPDEAEDITIYYSGFWPKWIKDLFSLNSKASSQSSESEASILRSCSDSVHSKKIFDYSMKAEEKKREAEEKKRKAEDTIQDSKLTTEHVSFWPYWIKYLFSIHTKPSENSPKSEASTSSANDSKSTGWIKWIQNIFSISKKVSSHDSPQATSEKFLKSEASLSPSVQDPKPAASDDVLPASESVGFWKKLNRKLFHRKSKKVASQSAASESVGFWKKLNRKLFHRKSKKVASQSAASESVGFWKKLNRKLFHRKSKKVASQSAASESVGFWKKRVTPRKSKKVASQSAASESVGFWKKRLTPRKSKEVASQSAASDILPASESVGFWKKRLTPRKSKEVASQKSKKVASQSAASESVGFWKKRVTPRKSKEVASQSAASESVGFWKKRLTARKSKEVASQSAASESVGFWKKRLTPRKSKKVASQEGSSRTKWNPSDQESKPTTASQERSFWPKSNSSVQDSGPEKRGFLDWLKRLFHRHSKPADTSQHQSFWPKSTDQESLNLQWKASICNCAVVFCTTEDNSKTIVSKKVSSHDSPQATSEKFLKSEASLSPSVQDPKPAASDDVLPASESVGFWKKLNRKLFDRKSKKVASQSAASESVGFWKKLNRKLFDRKSKEVASQSAASESVGFWKKLNRKLFHRKSKKVASQSAASESVGFWKKLNRKLFHRKSKKVASQSAASESVGFWKKRLTPRKSKKVASQSAASESVGFWKKLNRKLFDRKSKKVASQSAASESVGFWKKLNRKLFDRKSKKVASQSAASERCFVFPNWAGPACVAFSQGSGWVQENACKSV
ncbi:axoneme-associated protein mst101(2)-like [Penaeus vannamei]|uniref:axoneme-associated protein mst101(2)-like n=1 Tax=Penaeus vannamei TaxID=6689 RepID=UPI00387F4BE1